MAGAGRASVEYTNQFTTAVGAADRAAIDTITETLRDIVAGSGSTTRIVWDIATDAAQNVLYVLRLTTGEGSAITAFSGWEIEPDGHGVDYRLHSLYGAILRAYRAKQRSGQALVGG